MNRLCLLAMLLLSVYASNLRIESTTGLEAKRAAVAAQYQGVQNTGTLSGSDKMTIWREDSQMVWGYNADTNQEEAYLIDFRTDGGVRYIDGGWVQTNEENSVPNWVWGYLNEQEQSSDAYEF